MQKRLRKKQRLGEFQELGVEVRVTLEPGVDYDEFLDSFILDAIETNGLSFGGGGHFPELEGVVELGRSNGYLAALAKVRAWLANDLRVASYRFGEPVDLWYGDSEGDGLRGS